MNDLDQITTEDYSYVVTIRNHFIVILAVLQIIHIACSDDRSIFVTYFASVSMTQWILGWFGIEQLNWAVVLQPDLFALGIDTDIHH